MPGRDLTIVQYSFSTSSKGSRVKLVAYLYNSHSLSLSVRKSSALFRADTVSAVITASGSGVCGEPDPYFDNRNGCTLRSIQLTSTGLGDIIPHLQTDNYYMTWVPVNCARRKWLEFRR